MNEKRFKFAHDLLGSEVDINYRRGVPGEALKEQRVKLDRGITDEAGQKCTCANSGKRTAPPGVRIVESTCFSCSSNCELLIFVDEESGEVLKVEGDPESPITKGMLCAKGLASRNLVDNPERLTYPMKRIGARGEGKWERITWDEALTTTAKKLFEYREKYGPQGIAFLEGTRRGWSRVYSRLANTFGAVNHGAAGWAQCLWPRLVDTGVTFGAAYTETADFANTRCILVWGVNPPVTWPLASSNIMDARQRGAAIIVVDPYLSEMAAKADLWLQLRPGTDTALALSMMHVIIKEGLYDREFVEKWTVGFDDLEKHVEKLTPEWGEAVTRVPADLIRKAARLFADTAPACVYRCVALDMVHDSVQACRSVSLLTAITGNLDVPGGNILVSKRGEISQNTHKFIAADMIGEEEMGLRRGYDQYPLLCGKLCPVPSAHMPTLWDTIATGEPYPIKAALIFGSNVVRSYSNSSRVEEALKKLDFLVVADLFMTPTAEFADIVLPASSWLERNNVISSFQCSPTYTVMQQRATTVGEARSDVDIVCQLAKKLGLEEYFWEDNQGLYNYLLEPTGLTFEDLKNKRRLFAPVEYRQYEKNGFNTPSGKVELYSSLLEENGCDPLPVYTEPFQSPLSTPMLAEKYPYILTTGGRVPVFRHSENRNNPLLREIHPQATILIHPATAGAHDIHDGDQMIIESSAGRATGYARLTRGIQPDVIQATPGWNGTDNINYVVPWGQFAQGIGSVSMRGILCRVKKPVKNSN